MRLPAAVRVLGAVEVPAGFRARFDARSKTYRYRIWNAEVLSPFERRYAWHVPAPTLQVEAMASAALLLEGRHDVIAFQGTGSETLTTERIVFRSRLIAGADADGRAAPCLRSQGEDFSATWSAALPNARRDCAPLRRVPDARGPRRDRERWRAGPRRPPGSFWFASSTRRQTYNGRACRSSNCSRGFLPARRTRHWRDRSTSISCRRTSR